MICFLIGHEWKSDKDTGGVKCSRCGAKMDWEELFMKLLFV